MPPKRKAAASATSSSQSTLKNKKGSFYIPKSWLPPTSTIPEGEDFDLEPNEWYPTDGQHDMVPVYIPTWEQFKDFFTFCKRIRKIGMQHGIVKIVPPREWIEMQGDLSEKLKHLRIPNPLHQVVQSSGAGSYQQTCVPYPHTLTVEQWQHICASPGHRGPQLIKILEKLDEEYAMALQNYEATLAKEASMAKAKKRKRQPTEETPPAPAAQQDDAHDSAPAGPAPTDEPTLPTPPHSNSAVSPPADCHMTDATEEQAQAQTPASPPSQAPAAASAESAPAAGPPTTTNASTSTTAPATTDATSTSTPAWDYRRAWMQEYLPPARAATALPSEWTIDVCAAIELEYWRTLGALRSATSALTRTSASNDDDPVARAASLKGAFYGADISATLFDDDMKVWNIGRLDNVLTRMLGCIDEDGEWIPQDPDADDIETDAKGKGKGKGKGKQKASAAAAVTGGRAMGNAKGKATNSNGKGKGKKQSSAAATMDEGSASAIAGVTTPYLYFGMWQATFSWHVEDMDLCSINYIHFGAPKQWYAIPQKDAKRFETAMETSFPSDAKRCKQFLRHKSFLVKPSVLKQIKPIKCVQHAGEIMLTFPFGYHSGYNLGFNCAESTNFALEDWVQLGIEAKVCECADRESQVAIDVRRLYEEAVKAEKMEAGGVEEVDEEEDDEYVPEGEASGDDDDDDDAGPAVPPRLAPKPTPVTITIPAPAPAPAAKERPKPMKKAVRTGAGPGFRTVAFASLDGGLGSPAAAAATAMAAKSSSSSSSLSPATKKKTTTKKISTAAAAAAAAGGEDSDSSAPERTKKKAKVETRSPAAKTANRRSTSVLSSPSQPASTIGAGEATIAAQRARDLIQFEQERSQLQLEISQLRIRCAEAEAGRAEAEAGWAEAEERIAMWERKVEELKRAAGAVSSEEEEEDGEAEAEEEEDGEEEGESSSTPAPEYESEEEEPEDDDGSSASAGEEKRLKKNADARRRWAENRSRKLAGLPIVSRRGKNTGT
ncbi:hypothetical protein A4X06_0g2704 [Tilletia controversa]|uniref:[Histone H3]-trimethyl-L-lysine(9) demethylase n=1 Tax=Tilletia controversa TaxID=13291 RepID=A0A8X7MVD4_9BASI|nr:hypothetical protein A4X06_0g2704 [Tilletia controversa]